MEEMEEMDGGEDVKKRRSGGWGVGQGVSEAGDKDLVGVLDTAGGSWGDGRDGIHFTPYIQHMHTYIMYVQYSTVLQYIQYGTAMHTVRYCNTYSTVLQCIQYGTAIHTYTIYM